MIQTPPPGAPQSGDPCLGLCDPLQLARWQQRTDDERVARHIDLRAHKQQRMSAGPLAFLRGAAPLYYRLLQDSPELAAGPPGEGWIVGDLHIENLGFYRTGTPASDEDSPRAVFDVNDFDDAAVGPWRLDVLRLVTSLLLSLRAQAVPLAEAVQLSSKLLEAYIQTVFDGQAFPEMPQAVSRLLKRVEARTRQDLLDARTVLSGGERRFVRKPERYRELDSGLAIRAREAFAHYVSCLAPEERANPEAFDVQDMTYRVAGTGSLGSLRVAVLVRGKGGKNGGWIFDMKEEGNPSAAVLLGNRPQDEAQATRVVRALSTCLEQTPRMIGTTLLDGLSMLVRRLAPQEDRIDLGQVPPEQRAELARYIGALTARVHRRGATRVPDSRWTDTDAGHLIDKALLLAGAHEAAYQSYVRLTQT